MTYAEAHASKACWVCGAEGVHPPEPSILGKWWPWSCARHRLVFEVVPALRRPPKKKRKARR